jgi:demethylmenaquinone methyltransferase/2-methoxy-6-polyprenyl-1,4-benzoquinol methylase
MQRPVKGTPTFESDLQHMFTAISRRYSLFDHVSTFGADFVWRPRTLWDVDRWLGRAPERVLDIGCGPGDLTYLLATHYPSARIVGMDLTRAMVKVGEDLRDTRATGGRVDFGVADALRLPFPPATFDLVTSAFLLRNLKDLRGGFREMARVLRPAGVLMALDVTEPDSKWIGKFFHAYFDRVVPTLGAAFRNENAYRYLSDSLKVFPSRPRIVGLLRESGFVDARAVPQWFGVVTGFLGHRSQ